MHLSSVRHLLLSCQTSVLRGNIVFQKRLISSTSALSQSTRKILDDSDENTRKTKKEITDLPEKEIYPEYVQPAKGVVYDKKPFKYECIEGKAYVWCSCGRSHKQVRVLVIENYFHFIHCSPLYPTAILRWDSQEQTSEDHSPTGSMGLH